jgi:hypothetical protein
VVWRWRTDVVREGTRSGLALADGCGAGGYSEWSGAGGRMGCGRVLGSACGMGDLAWSVCGGTVLRCRQGVLTAASAAASTKSAARFTVQRFHEQLSSLMLTIQRTEASDAAIRATCNSLCNVQPTSDRRPQTTCHRRHASDNVQPDATDF